jgi:small subunit ribosomal protein S4
MRRLSDRGQQLREKQKIRYTYDVMERQFRRFFTIAEKQSGITGDNLLVLLERRLDNVIFRLGFADSRAQARQLVFHGHILINNKKTDIPSYLINEGDVISFNQTSTKSGYYKVLTDLIEGKPLPSWLSLDRKKMTAQVVNLPTAGDIELVFNPQSVVEYYSR